MQTKSAPTDFFCAVKLRKAAESHTVRNLDRAVCFVNRKQEEIVIMKACDNQNEDEIEDSVVSRKHNGYRIFG
jgi:hypothetical protein